MTAPLQENSVLSDLTGVVAPARCDEGKRLHHEWAMAVNAEKNPTECIHLMFAPRRYDKHAENCDACYNYELAKRAYQAKVEEK